jgi:hypothetical protein
MTNADEKIPTTMREAIAMGTGNQKILEEVKFPDEEDELFKLP